MENINKAVFSGNLTRDPEVRQTQSGTPVMTFGVATSDRRKDPQTDEWRDYPNFVDCVMFGKRADALSQHMYKGQKVVVEGKLRYSSWEKDGQKRSKIEIAVDNVDLADAKPQQQQCQAPQQYHAQPYQQPQQYAAQQAPQAYQQQQYVAQQPPVVDTSSMIYDEDIPF